MKYVDNIELGKKIIIDKYPSFINSMFSADNSGWTNFAIKVDNKYIFRFPRNDEASKAIAKEYKVLNILNQKLPINIKVPNYIYSNLDNDYPFVGYELIEGDFLTKEKFDNLSIEERTKLIDNMAIFLNTLHSIDYKDLNLTPTNPIVWYKNLYKRIQNICFKYFDEELKKDTIRLFESYFNDETMRNYKPTLIHGDLSEDHILITKDGIGVIDFGDLMVFDPAYDLIWSYICGTDFYKLLINKYNGNKDNYFEHKIRDFHIIRPPYDGIIYAEEIKDQKLLNKEIKTLKNNFLNNCRE